MRNQEKHVKEVNLAVEIVLKALEAERTWKDKRDDSIIEHEQGILRHYLCLIKDGFIPVGSEDVDWPFKSGGLIIHIVHREILEMVLKGVEIGEEQEAELLKHALKIIDTFHKTQAQLGSPNTLSCAQYIGLSPVEFVKTQSIVVKPPSLWTDQKKEDLSCECCPLCGAGLKSIEPDHTRSNPRGYSKTYLCGSVFRLNRGGGRDESTFCISRQIDQGKRPEEDRELVNWMALEERNRKSGN